MDGRGPPLAVTDDAYRTGRIVLEPGSLVLLYTDGAIERDRDLERGMAELAELVAGGSDADPGHLLARLAGAVGPEPADDCAFLALRVPGPRPRCGSRYPPAPRPCAERGPRCGAGCSTRASRERDADDVVLAASEAIANSVEHAYAGRPPAAPRRGRAGGGSRDGARRPQHRGARPRRLAAPGGRGHRAGAGACC